VTSVTGARKIDRGKEEGLVAAVSFAAGSPKNPSYLKMKATLFALLALATTLLGFSAAPEQSSPVGYSDTPLIPGSKWKVHDIDRPRPDAVKPADKPGGAPADAVVIFDGTNTDQIVSKNGAPCPWAIEHGEVLIKGGDCWTKASFASCQLHLEWKSDPATKGNSQLKGNSGVFFMDRYESQILDCDHNLTYADGMAGAVYGQTPPLVNAVRKAGEWQIYDIVFTAPKLEGGKVVEPAYVTTFLNGMCVQNHTSIMGPTKHRETTNYEGDFPDSAPVRLQDHGNSPPVRLRNIWIRPL
jgi:hypothetical protein